MFCLQNNILLKVYINLQCVTLLQILMLINKKIIN